MLPMLDNTLRALSMMDLVRTSTAEELEKVVSSSLLARSSGGI
jgi:hypothetical protein